MPDAPAILVHELVKDYRLYARPSDLLREFVSRRPRHTTVRALDHVSFRVERGEVIGVLGRNGAGKSTLLKILTGVLDHDAGRVAVDGRVSAILELGAGIDPESSGRDNIVFGGICRGVSKAEMTRRLPEIAAFAELEEVLDRPFRSYSSGMQARLLFSTAIQIDGDVLIIDEALAAGDALFQEKCLRRMREIAKSGRTILFVSHSIQMIQQLCTRALLLHEGRIVEDGATAAVAHAYHAILADARNRSARQGAARPRIDDSRVDEAENDPTVKCFIASVALLDEDGNPVRQLEHGRSYSLRQVLCFNDDVPHLVVGARFHLPSGLDVYSFQNVLRQIDLSGRKGERKEVLFDFQCRFGAGEYVCSTGVGEVLDASKGLFPAPLAILHFRNSVLAFTVTQEPTFGGIFDLDVDVRVNDLAGSS